MSAIDTTFHWVRNPTAINGLATTYVSKRGSDTTGNGTANNPYASIAKATAMATANTNIMLDDGEWNEARTLNEKIFIFWGNAKTIIGDKTKTVYHNYIYTYFHYIYCFNLVFGTYNSGTGNARLYNCFVYNCNSSPSNESCSWSDGFYLIENCICIKIYSAGNGYGGSNFIKNSILINSILGYNESVIRYSLIENVVFCGCTTYNNLIYTNCNFTNGTIPQNSNKSINNATTNQTLVDYFNYLPQSIIDNPTTPNVDDWLKCDFTAKEGSKNIGSGEKGTTIGLNKGYTMYADNSANDVFKISNGATLKNIEWNSTLNGYALIQKERICAGATASTITLDSSASSEDDYYNNLFIGIVAGDGYGELFLITDYDGATKTATIDGTWTTTPTTNSIYTISGTIFSATKDLGKVIKVKRNWTIADNFTALTDGRWAEFMTHVETNGKQFPVSCYSYEYSIDGVTFVQGQTADDLVSATNGDNKVTDKIYGDCSPNYVEASAKNLIMRYIRVRVNIGFNIG